MSLFSGPDEHAANPPASWRAVKVGDHAWQLQTADGGTLDSYSTRKAAEQDKTTGPWVRLYEQDGRWYAGHTPPGHKSYAECVAEQERAAVKRTRRVQAYAARFIAETTGLEPPRHLEPTDDALREVFAPCGRPAPADLYDDIRAELARIAAGTDEHPAAADPQPDPPAAPIVVASRHPMAADGDTMYRLSNGWIIYRNERTHRRTVRDCKYSAWEPGGAPTGGAALRGTATSLAGMLERLNTMLRPPTPADPHAAAREAIEAASAAVDQARADLREATMSCENAAIEQAMAARDGAVARLREVLAEHLPPAAGTAAKPFVSSWAGAL